MIAEWTRVPLNRLSQDALAVVTELPAYLEESIKGQDLAIAHLHKHLLTARADLRRPGRPLGLSCWSVRAAWGKPKRYYR